MFSDGVTWTREEIAARVVGTGGNDSYVGFTGVSNNMRGLAGNDTLTGQELADTLDGSDGNDRLYGGAGDDLLVGGKGNDVLNGGAGNDTYVLSQGDGEDVINDHDPAAGNSDVVQFRDVKSEQLWFRQVGFDLEVSTIGTGDKTTIGNWYSGKAYRVEQFQASDGKALLENQVDALIAAMAAFAPPAAGQTTLAADYQMALQPVIAANWK